MIAPVTHPTISQTVEIIEVLKANAGFVCSIDLSDDECVRREAEDWAMHGFAPEEVAVWIQAGYEGASSVARMLRNAGLIPWQAKCAMADNGYLLSDKEINLYRLCEFIRRALKYRTCCIGRR